MTTEIEQLQDSCSYSMALTQSALHATPEPSGPKMFLHVAAMTSIAGCRHPAIVPSPVAAGPKLQGAD